ncbi:hypothetical protein O0L34_g19085 [Tuta absoluta]|nr:hypothetical protein O0L34_g19085 [Tuta absoluta]
MIENEKNAVKQKQLAKKKKTVRKVMQSDDEEEETECSIIDNVTKKPKKRLLEKEKRGVKQAKVGNKNKAIQTCSLSDEEEEEEKDIEIKLTDSKEYSDEADFNQNDDEEMLVLTESHFKQLRRHPREDEYVIVQFETKRLRSLYIGKVLEGKNNDLEYYVSFLRQKSGTQRFHVPDKPDLSVVKENDIKFILPKPSMVGTSSRPMYSYSVDLTKFKTTLKRTIDFFI